MNKINNTLNALSVLTSLTVLSWFWWSRLNMPLLLSAWNYISVFSLAAVIFCLPDFLCHFFPPGNKWFRTSGFYTGLLIVLLSVSGMFLASVSSLVSMMIIPAGILLALWEVYRFVRSGMWLPMIAGFATMLFIVFMFFSSSYSSPLYPERIILGIAHIDTLFLSSMSNMFSTLGWPSTGVDGAPFVHYHFGSQALFGGMKSWTGMNALMFYNIAFPAIFIPLFFKTLLEFLQKVYLFKRINSLNLVFAFTFILVLLSLKIVGFGLRSENTVLSFIYTFLFASILLGYIPVSRKHDYHFYIFTVITVLVIASFKISTGVVVCIGLLYLYFRTNMNIRDILTLSITLLLITAVIYLFIFPFGYVNHSLTLLQRLGNFWITSDSFIINFIGAFLAIFLVLKKKPIRRWRDLRDVLRSGEFLDVEILFVMTIAGLLGSLVVSSSLSDAYCFISVQLFLTIPYLIMFGQKFFDRFASSEKFKTAFFFLVIFFSLISRTDILKISLAETAMIKNSMVRLNPRQEMYKGFIASLFRLEKEPGKKKTCIYIPKTEKWYYESQVNKPFMRPISKQLGSPLVVPAITGIALIGGFPDTLYSVRFNAYGYNFYRKDRGSVLKNLMEAKQEALAGGYARLIEYQCIDGKIVMQSLHLKETDPGFVAPGMTIRQFLQLFP